MKKNKKKGCREVERGREEEGLKDTGRDKGCLRKARKLFSVSFFVLTHIALFTSFPSAFTLLT